MNEKQEEQKAKVRAESLEKRIASFNPELQRLLEKYELAIGAQAGLTPDGRILARPVILDDDPAKKETGIIKPE